MSEGYVTGQYKLVPDSKYLQKKATFYNTVKVFVINLIQWLCYYIIEWCVHDYKGDREAQKVQIMNNLTSKVRIDVFIIPENFFFCSCFN